MLMLDGQDDEMEVMVYDISWGFMVISYANRCLLWDRRESRVFDK